MTPGIDDDELEKMVLRSPTAREEKRDDHGMMFKALGNPVRRKLFVSIGAFGKALPDIMEEMDVDRSQVVYHLDFLKNGGYVTIEEDIVRLTDRGLGMLSNI